MLKQIAISILTALFLFPTLHAEGTNKETQKKLTKLEQNVIDCFRKFKSKPNKDTYDKLTVTCNEVRTNNQQVVNIVQYVKATKKLKDNKKLKITFLKFYFDDEFNNTYEGDNNITVHQRTKDGKTKEILNIGDIEVASGEFSEIKHKIGFGALTRDLILENDDFTNIYFENWKIWSFNPITEDFQIDLYEILAETIDTGSYIKRLQTQKNEYPCTYIDIEFSNLPTISE